MVTQRMVAQNLLRACYERHVSLCFWVRLLFTGPEFVGCWEAYGNKSLQTPIDGLGGVIIFAHVHVAATDYISKLSGW